MLRYFTHLILLAIFLLPAARSLAWGQLKDLNDPVWTKTFLAPLLRDRGQIRYCLEIDPSVASRFPQESLIIQIEAVYQEWLAPVRAQGLIGDVTITKVSCKDRDFDVKVAIGPDAKYPNIGAYQIESQEAGRWYSLVKLNTNYKSTAPDEIVDIKALLGLPNLNAVSNLMVKFEQTPALSVKGFAHDHDQVYGPMFWTSYRVLLHEMGHAFGLCDTLEPIAHDHCDPTHLTSVYKNSVMSDSNYLSLTDDDRDGIVSLFRRFAPPGGSAILAGMAGTGAESAAGKSVPSTATSGLSASTASSPAGVKSTSPGEAALNSGSAPRLELIQASGLTRQTR